MQEYYVKKFQTTILKIKKVLSEIHSLGIDTSKIETVINKIQEDANEESIALYLK